LIRHSRGAARDVVVLQDPVESMRPDQIALVVEAIPVLGIGPSAATRTAIVPRPDQRFRVRDVLRFRVDSDSESAAAICRSVLGT